MISIGALRVKQPFSYKKGTYIFRNNVLVNVSPNLMDYKLILHSNTK